MNLLREQVIDASTKLRSITKRKEIEVRLPKKNIIDTEWPFSEEEIAEFIKSMKEQIERRKIPVVEHKKESNFRKLIVESTS